MGAAKAASFLACQLEVVRKINFLQTVTRDSNTASESSLHIPRGMPPGPGWLLEEAFRRAREWRSALWRPGAAKAGEGGRGAIGSGTSQFSCGEMS